MRPSPDPVLDSDLAGVTSGPKKVGGCDGESSGPKRAELSGMDGVGLDGVEKKGVFLPTSVCRVSFSSVFFYFIFRVCLGARVCVLLRGWLFIFFSAEPLARLNLGSDCTTRSKGRGSGMRTYTFRMLSAGSSWPLRFPCLAACALYLPQHVSSMHPNPLCRRGLCGDLAGRVIVCFSIRLFCQSHLLILFSLFPTIVSSTHGEWFTMAARWCRLGGFVALLFLSSVALPRRPWDRLRTAVFLFPREGPNVLLVHALCRPSHAMPECAAIGVATHGFFREQGVLFFRRTY